MVKPALTIHFEAKLLRPADGAPWSFIRLPADASAQLASRGLVSVEGTINGADFQATLHPDGDGGHWFRVEPELSHRAAVRPGETISLEMTPSSVEPEPEVPADLIAALAQAPQAMAVWTEITPTARRDWIQWMTSGKKAETRVTRLTTMMDMLTKGKRRICCFDRSGMYSKSFSCPEVAVD